MVSRLCGEIKRAPRNIARGSFIFSLWVVLLDYQCCLRDLATSRGCLYPVQSGGQVNIDGVGEEAIGYQP